MPDPFDNLGLHLCTIMLAAFKLTHFIAWSWWIIAVPSIIALILYLLTWLMMD